jgi:hypothetical protein
VVVNEATKLAPEEPIGLKAVLRAVEMKTAKIEDIVVMATRPDEFNLEALPIPDMASVSTRLQEGISCQEILTSVKAGELPSLNLPENQWPLVQIMDKLGHTATVSQIIVQEPKLNLMAAEINQLPVLIDESIERFMSTQSIGLRALIQIAIQKSVSVSEVITMDKVKELLPSQVPDKEFLKIDALLKSGVTVDEIIAVGATGNLPVLTAPESQNALVRLVEDQGFKAVVRQVKYEKHAMSKKHIN